MKNIFQQIKDTWLSRQRTTIIITALLAFLTGFLLTQHSPPPSDRLHSQEHRPGEASPEDVFWTCSMHPQIRQPRPGKCPICAMDLISVASSQAGQSGPAARLELSAEAIKRAEIQTVPAQKKFLSKHIRLPGKIHIDETRQKTITAWIPGRIDKMFVNYTGAAVHKGDAMILLYSPVLITAQQELSSARRLSAHAVEDVREKLRLWGLSNDQIQEFESAKEPQTKVTIHSPMDGIIINRLATEGVYLQTGSPIYTLADLSSVWIKLDAYESDLPWIRYAQEVEFSVDSYPGEIFSGRIAFIDPVLDPSNRTVGIRVNANNRDSRLKPGMLTQARIKARLSASGKVLDAHLAGKWIAPEHPEIIKDRPGTCDICGQALVPAETLGYTDEKAAGGDAPLVIPASATLLTGKRAVVYVEQDGKPGRFEGRELVLGPRVNDHYIVRKGLEEGEHVVVNGAFKIDSDLQIKARPSMMNPEHPDDTISPSLDKHPGLDMEPSRHKAMSHTKTRNESFPRVIIPPEEQQWIQRLAHTYLNMQRALADDNPARLTDYLQDSVLLLNKITAGTFAKNLAPSEGKMLTELNGTVTAMGKAPDINALRTLFASLSDGIITLLRRSRIRPGDEVYLVHCPMALDNKGAYWLQLSGDVKNPYFGAAMLTCHDHKEPFLAEKSAVEK